MEGQIDFPKKQKGLHTREKGLLNTSSFSCGQNPSVVDLLSQFGIWRNGRERREEVVIRVFEEAAAAMEGITEGVNNMSVSEIQNQKKNRIQVSNTKRSLFFYVNLAKVLFLFFY